MENLLVSNCTLGCIFDLTVTRIFASFLLSGRLLYNLVPRVLSYPSLRSERELGTRLGASIVAKERSFLFTLVLACKMGGTRGVQLLFGQKWYVPLNRVFSESFSSVGVLTEIY